MYRISDQISQCPKNASEPADFLDLSIQNLYIWGSSQVDQHLATQQDDVPGCEAHGMSDQRSRSAALLTPGTYAPISRTTCAQNPGRQWRR